MIRQQRRRIERQWSKIKVGAGCTEFIERNSLFALPHVIAFQAVKVSEVLACVYNVGLFDSKRDSGHGEYVTTCLFVNGTFRSLGSVQIAFIPEGDLWENEEIDI
ncbi:MAG: hypothetical protein GX799_01215 [Crenarchaeota archaeon]|jgi:hypothetical protein|nr:hypothetical protein [Thermoproteota archaeon]